MSGQPEAQERLYVLEKLSGARSAILKGSADLLTNRARVEKYRETDPHRAQDAYIELQKARDRVLTALGEAQLALLETEEDNLASFAGKLLQGLGGFNLMTRAYKPVYEALTGFAKRLPETQDTVNAAVIGRLMNHVRMGYYPTDPENISHILKGIKFPEGVTTNLEEHGGFITKWDGAEDTDIEAIKGGLSDSMKRAAVQWGIGRVLYKMDVVWVDVEKSGKSWIIKGSERAKLDAAYLNLLKRLKLTPAKPGGLQSELTAANEPETLPENERQSKVDAKSPTQKQQGSKAPEAPTQGQPSPVNITELPPAKQPEPEYKVKSAKVQSGMSRNPTTSLTLIGRDGKPIQAFLRGTDPALVPDALLTNVDLTLRQQDTVIFFVLNSYEVIKNMPQAA